MACRAGIMPYGGDSRKVA